MYLITQFWNSSYNIESSYFIANRLNVFNIKNWPTKNCVTNRIVELNRTAKALN